MFLLLILKAYRADEAINAVYNEFHKEGKTFNIIFMDINMPGVDGLEVRFGLSL
jgi:CheY-like chemotaxis protein